MTWLIRNEASHSTSTEMLWLVESWLLCSFMVGASCSYLSLKGLGSVHKP